MKAVVLHEYGGPEKLKFEDNVPDPGVSEDTVLVAAIAASVNPIDWKVRSGTRRKDFPLTFPAILGRDVSGVVRAVGNKVKHFKPGDRVLAFSNKTYAELVAVPDSDVTHLPDGVDPVDAAAIPVVPGSGTGRGEITFGSLNNPCKINAPLLGLWFFAPLIAWWLSRPVRDARVELHREDVRLLRRIATKPAQAATNCCWWNPSTSISTLCTRLTPPASASPRAPFTG